MSEKKEYFPLWVEKKRYDEYHHLINVLQAVCDEFYNKDHVYKHFERKIEEAAAEIMRTAIESDPGGELDVSTPPQNEIELPIIVSWPADATIAEKIDIVKIAQNMAEMGAGNFPDVLRSLVRLL